MHHVTSSQVRAARALLGWKQDNLAIAADISLTALRSFEMGIAPRGSTMNAICQALENAGIEFTENEGVCRKITVIKVFNGHDGYDRFFEHVLQTARIMQDDFHAVITAPELASQLSGTGRHNYFDKLEQVHAITPVKCLVSDLIKPVFDLPPYPCRSVANSVVGLSPYFVYGEKYATILPESHGNYLFLEFHIPQTAQNYRKRFLSLWENALPLSIPVVASDQRARVSI